MPRHRRPARPSVRGTNNSSTRGSSYDRRARRAFLSEKFGTASGGVKCFWCDKVMYEPFEVDRWPVCGHDGGRYTRDNIVPSCSSCNNNRCTTAKNCRAHKSLKRSWR